MLLSRLGPNVSTSGLPYTGDPETDEVLDDPELVERILAHRRQFEGLTAKEGAAELEVLRKSGQLFSLAQVLAEENAR